MMKTFSERAVPVEIVVELFPILASFADLEEQRIELHDRLLRYINQVTTGLQLPLTPSLTIRKLATALDHPIARSYQLSIAGQPCRLPMSTSLFLSSDTLTLATEIGEAICQNREQFITPILVETIYRDLVGEDNKRADCLSSETLRQLLRELIRRGFGIHRGFEFVRSCQDGEFYNSNAAKLFEQAIASLDSLSISLWTSTSFQGFTPQQSVSTEVSAYSTQIAVERTESESESQSNSQAMAAIDESKSDSQSNLLIDERSRQIQEELFYELGLLFPLVHIQRSQNFRNNEFQVQLNDLQFPSIFESDLESVIESLKDRIRQNAGAFLNIEIWQYYLKLLKPQFPVLVDAIAKNLDTIFVIRILRTLLDEEISIQDIPTILESLLDINGSATVDQSRYIVFFPNTTHFLCASLQAIPDSNFYEKDVIAYTDAVRTNLKRSISYKYARGSNTLLVYLLDSKIEEKIQLIDADPLQPEEHNYLLEAIFETVDFSAAQTYIILTTVETRKRLRQLIDVEFPKLPVLSYQELSPDLNIQPLDRISLLR